MRASAYEWYNSVPTAIWFRLGKCNQYGFAPNDSSGANERGGDETLAAAMAVLNQFTPTDADFVDFLRSATPDEIDAFAATVTASADMVYAGIAHYSRALAELGRLRPRIVSEGIQLIVGDAFADKRRFAIDLLVLWRSQNPDPLLGELDVAGRVADGLGHGRKEASNAGRSRRTEPAPIDPIVSMTSDLVARALDTDYQHEPLRKARRRHLRQTAVAHPDEWLSLLPWVAQLFAEPGVLLDAVAWALDGGTDPAPTFRAIACGPVQPAADRAAAVLEVLEGANKAAALLSVLARDHDFGLAGAFPHPLAAPTSTWLSSRDLEGRLREAVRTAVSRWSIDFVAHARSEEEGHTAALMTQIQQTIENAGALNVAETGRRPVELAGDYRKVSKTEEATVRADLALVIRIDIHGELRARYADLVQVKKTQHLPTGPTGTTTGTPDSDKWKIEISQLRGLLAKSPTAVYWLLAHDGEVLVVPAKLLLAIVDAKAKDDQETLTVHYSQVRHAAISLDSYLVDLTVGTWVGSNDDDMIALATGTPGRTTVASSVFELSVRLRSDG